MLVTAEQLKELPVKLAPPQKIRRILIDYKKISIAGLEVGKKGIFGRPRIYSMANTKIDERGITIINLEDLLTKEQIDDSMRFGELEDREVITQRRRVLGRLATYKIDTETGLIIGLWVRSPVALRNLWRQTLIIGREQILNISSSAIIVDDNIIKTALKPEANAEFIGEPDIAMGAASEYSLERQSNK